MAKIAIWGTGADAKRLVNHCKCIEGNTDFYINSNQAVSKFREKPVYKPDDINWEGTFVIIATTLYYDEIKQKLVEKGLRENYDFTNAINACMLEGYISLFNQVTTRDNLSEFKLGFWKSCSGIKDNLRLAFSIQQEEKCLDGEIFRFAGDKMVQFINYYYKLSEWIVIDNEKIYNEIDEVLYDYFFSPVHITEIILSKCVNLESNTVRFVDGTVLEYCKLHDFAVTFEEIILDEDYYFEADKTAPYIIDGGANIGLAIYYFKHLYPESKITAFEPVPELFHIIERNIKRNDWKDVELYPYALDGEDQIKTFYISDSSIAGSLVDKEDIETGKIEVKCTTLGKYIKEPVDYLKLDIEGSETKVFEEICDRLQYVEHIFFEYHEGIDFINNSLAKILTILDENNFKYNVDKSIFYSKTRLKPMQFVGGKMSEVIWAKQDRK